MSGNSGSGRHVASHAKPGAMSQAKGKVKTAAAVTSVLAVSGGVATAFHLHQDGLRNSAEASSQGADSSAAIAAAHALALRAAGASTPAANRDMQRPGLGQNQTPDQTRPSTPGVPLPSAGSDPSAAAKKPIAVSSSGSARAVTPKPPASTSTTSTGTPLPSTTPTTTRSTTPTPTKTTTTPPPTSSSSGSVSMGYDATPAQAKAIAEQVVPSGQYECFADIIERESSWNIYATNPSSGAYGLGQALPGDKMATMGSAWRNSALIQIKWALSYMNGRYGSPCAAWTFWQAHDWY